MFTLALGRSTLLKRTHDQENCEPTRDLNIMEIYFRNITFITILLGSDYNCWESIRRTCATVTYHYYPYGFVSLYEIAI